MIMKTLDAPLLTRLAAEFGTPSYVYDAAVIRDRVRQLRSFDTIRFAQKACSNVHLLRLMRGPKPGGIAFEPLASRYTLGTLLRQVVIPDDRSTANRILSAVAPTAAKLRGFDVVVGENAYSRISALDSLESALR